MGIKMQQEQDQEQDQEQEKIRRYKQLRGRRKVLYILFFPLGILLMAVGQGMIFAVPALLAWPLLVMFAVGYAIAMRLIDVCPWCGKSFHASWSPNASPSGFGGLIRKSCANCGRPDNAEAG